MPWREPVGDRDHDTADLAGEPLAEWVVPGDAPDDHPTSMDLVQAWHDAVAR
jgi:hypothetical protein